MVDIAQLVSVPGCGPGGRGFESHYSPHNERYSAKSSYSSILTKISSDSNGQKSKQSCELFACPGVIVQTLLRSVGIKKDMCLCRARTSHRSNGANPTIHPIMNDTPKGVSYTKFAQLRILAQI